SYDNSTDLGADRWRHVKFIEEKRPQNIRGVDGDGVATYQEGDGLRWLMASDVCKHCTHAACLDVCPTGALFRTEYGTVVVLEDDDDGVGGAGAFFLLLDEPEVYGLPPDPVDTRRDLGRIWAAAGAAAVAMGAGLAAAVFGGRG